MNNQELFAKNNYVVVRNLLDPYLVKFLASYYSAVRAGQAGEFKKDWSSLNSHGDVCGDVVLYSIRTLIAEHTGLDLLPTYSFTRIYKKGERIGRHADGPQNQVSCSMCVARGEVDWPVHLSDGEHEGGVVLQAGDGVIYRGHKVEHWREKFTGDNQVQVIVGYVEKGGEFDHHRFYGRGEPMYAAFGVKGPGPVGFAKAVLLKLKSLYRGELMYPAVGIKRKGPASIKSPRR
jgi:hypothetical protein